MSNEKINKNCFCNEKQIEIKSNESPSDYGSDANVVFCRNGKYYIDNPNYRSHSSYGKLAICISILVLLIQLLSIVRLLQQ